MRSCNLPQIWQGDAGILPLAIIRAKDHRKRRSDRESEENETSAAKSASL
jgi:hypothetical protein